MKPSAKTIRRANSFRGIETTRPPLTNVVLPEATSMKPSVLRKLLPGGTSLASSRPPLLRRRSGTQSGAWMATANSLSRGPLLTRMAKSRLPTNRRPMQRLESKPPSAAPRSSGKTRKQPTRRKKKKKKKKKKKPFLWTSSKAP